MMPTANRTMTVMAGRLVTGSRNPRRWLGLESALISGFSLSYSLWVGMIEILIVWWFKRMEHLNYAFHP